jgi:hypothetical protein
MEDQRAHPAEIVSPSVKERSHKPLPGAGRPSKREKNARVPMKNRHLLSLKRPIQKPARPLEFAT